MMLVASNVTEARSSMEVENSLSPYINIMSDINAIYLVKQRWCHIGVLYNVSGGSGIPCSSQLQETQDSINLVERGSWMKVEVKWKWKLDRSGS